MTKQQTSQDEDELRRLNEEIRNHEFAGNREFFKQCLADNLIFRRARGAVVDKPTFLKDLKPDQYVMLESTIGPVDVKDNSAVVDVMVQAQRHGQEPGTYRNIRMFQRNQNGWQLVAWINTEVEN
jgi:hypothetical protein